MNQIQFPPLIFSDITLLLTVCAIILLIAAELTAPSHGLTNLTLNQKRLRSAALVFGILLLVTVAVRIASIIG
jgi:hypothetical protein